MLVDEEKAEREKEKEMERESDGKGRGKGRGRRVIGYNNIWAAQSQHTYKTLWLNPSSSLLQTTLMSTLYQLLHYLLSHV